MRSLERWLVDHREKAAAEWTSAANTDKRRGRHSLRLWDALLDAYTWPSRKTAAIAELLLNGKQRAHDIDFKAHALTIEFQEGDKVTRLLMDTRSTDITETKPGVFTISPRPYPIAEILDWSGESLHRIYANPPIRIRRERTKGWRKPEGVVNVTRGSDWGNPYRAGELLLWPTDEHPSLMIDRALAVAMFKRLVDERGWAEQIKQELGGKDLMCYCPLDQPCHADYLLLVANS